MKIKALKLFVATVLLIAAMLLPLLTVGNAGWHVRRAFPTATVYFEPVNSPDFTFSAMLRVVLPSYFAFDESLGVRIIDAPGDVDLQRGFALIPHKSFFSARLIRCTVISLCDTNEIGNPSFIVFEDCDFTGLPEDQKVLLRPYDPQNPKDKRVCIGSV